MISEMISKHTCRPRRVKGLRKTGGGDQADIFNLIQNNSQITSGHIRVDKALWKIARGSEKQAGGSVPFAHYMSGLWHTDDAPHT